MKKPKRPNTTTTANSAGADDYRPGNAIIAFFIAALWWLGAVSTAARRHLLLGYATVGVRDPRLEPFFSSNATWIFCSVVAIAWFVMQLRQQLLAPGSVSKAWGAMAAASLPAILYIFRAFQWPAPPVAYWQPLWIATWTGVSFRFLMNAETDSALQQHQKKWSWAVIAFSVALGVWWFGQSRWYFQHFQLGYNDFGQFLQRVANTAHGRGFLEESPVLGPFWDHFNPGLALLVPLWSVFPSPYLALILQAVCIAGSAILVYWLASGMGMPTRAAAMWAIAWLLQPALGQINLSYTYGWHPISLALPLLIAALGCLVRGRVTIAVTLALLAMAMQEGVIVLVGCFCAVGTWLSFLSTRHPVPAGRVLQQEKVQETSAIQNRWTLAGTWLQRSTAWWLTAWLVCVMVFGLVYRYSGLAEFQRGRFHVLGGSTWEVLLSPFLRPEVFWGQVLQLSNAAFLLSLVIPCFLPVVMRSWRIQVALIPPLLVLFAWDHVPSTSLAFHYPTLLLPVMWFGVLSASSVPRDCFLMPGNVASRKSRQRASASIALAWAAGAAVSGAVLSLYVGQLPYSNDSLLDVRAQTYGIGGDWSRGPDTELGRWLHAQTERLRAEGQSVRVLATGRAAAHLVGVGDLETVRQYWTRRPQLADLPDRRGHPLRAYDYVLIDRDDLLHQSAAEIKQIEQEAIQEGFRLVDQLETAVLYQRTGNQPLQRP